MEVLEGRGGWGWSGFILELLTMLEIFQTWVMVRKLITPFIQGYPRLVLLISLVRMFNDVFSASGVCSDKRCSQEVVCQGLGWTREVYGEIHVMHGGRRQAGCCSVVGLEVIGHGVPRDASNPMFYIGIDRGADSWEWFQGCKGR